MSIPLTSNAFENEQTIPSDYTQDGKNVSPPLNWGDGPVETVEYALVADDPDAPTHQPFVHWVMYKIPSSVDHLQEGVPALGEPPMPRGVRQGANDSGSAGYVGPAPPKGHGTHRYHFKLYALDAPIELPPEASKKELFETMQGHVLDEGKLIGTYER